MSGTINLTTTWTQEGSPYLVTDTVEVAEGVTLSIGAGVSIVFGEGTSLTVRDQLLAIGTQGEMITFTSGKETPSPGDWEGIIFKDSAIDATVESEYRYQSGSTLTYCTIEYAGPGITCESSSPFIAHCTITHNTAESGGGGIYLAGDAVVINNLITDNQALDVPGDGGGIYNLTNAATIAGNLIEGNYAFNHGGGLFVAGNSVVKGNVIMDNCANGCGGGIYIDYGAPTIENNGIVNNAAEASGGGVYSEWGTATLRGNCIHTNTAQLYGGGMCIVDGSVVIESTSVVNNTTADFLGGGIYYTSESIFDNSSLMISSSNIESNQGYDIYNGSRLEIAAGNNYWGTIDTALLDENIFDMADDRLSGPVTYEPAASQPYSIVDLAVIPSSPYFGSVNLESSATHTLTIFNLGIEDRTTGTLSLNGENASEFSIQNDHCSASTLAPLANCTVDMVFSPTQIGLRNATLSIPYTAVSTTTLEVTLSGTGALSCPIEEIYGSNSVEAALLRHFRDDVLDKTPEGQTLIQWYYKHSPALVKVMREDEALREELKTLIDGVLPLVRIDAN